MSALSLDKTYIAFGDGSSGDAGSFYGLVLIPIAIVQHVENEIGAIKQKYGGQINFPIHCRELFNDVARSKGVWAHLQHHMAVDLCGDVLEAVQLSEPIYLLGHIPKQHYPKYFRLVGKNGHEDLVHKIDEKWLQLWAYFRVGGLLDPVNPIIPDDPIAKPRSHNRPYWNMVIKRVDPGFRVKQVFLDREHTKIQWFSKSLQWISVAKELVIENRDGPSYLPIVHASDTKHFLLDVADIFTYSMSRVFAGNREIDYRRFCGEVLVMQMPYLGDEIVAGSNLGQ